MNPRSSRIRRVLPAVLATVISGCATPVDLPMAPLASSDGRGPITSSSESGSSYGGAWRGLNGRFYPLQIGNRWHYRRHLVYTLIPNEGAPPPPYELDATIDRELVCVEHRDGRDYVVEQAEEQTPDQSFRSWILFRQDLSGLYEGDISILDPPSCVVPVASTSTGSGSERSARLARCLDALIPAGPPAREAAFRTAIQGLREKLALLDAATGMMTRTPAQATGAQVAGGGELTRLRYPLYPGARWIIRNEPAFTARVEGADVLALPAGRLRGFRIRLSGDLLDPNDTIRVWYGTSGFLQLAVHAEYDAIDVFGQVVGRVMFDQRDALDDFQLSGPVVTWPPAGGWLRGR